MPSEEEIRAWVRDEQATIQREREEACSHSVSGTLGDDGKVTCTTCGGVIADWTDPDQEVPFRGYGQTETVRNKPRQAP